MSQEPQDLNEVKSNGPTVPIFFFILTALLLLGGAIYVDLHGGGFNAQVYAPYSNYEYVKEIGRRGDSGLDGAPIYSLYCSPCHQPSGLGTPGQVPPLANSDWVNVEGPNRMIRLVLDGIQGPIKVNGEDFNSAMLPWKEQLTDEQIAAVLTYVRSNWGNKGAPVAPKQVKTIREEEKGRSSPWDPAKLMETSDK